MAATYGKTNIGSATANASSSTVTAINATGRPRLVRALIEKLDYMGYDLSNQFGKGEAIDNPKLEWTDKVFGAITATTDTAGYNNSVTTVNVASGHGNRIQVYDVLRVASTGENMWVTAVSTDALTVVRGVGGTTAASISAAANTLQILGPAVPENVISPAAVLARGEFYNNYIQQFIYAIQVSDIQANTNTSYLIEGNEYRSELKKQLMEARRDFERTLFYGGPAAASGTAASFMGGFPAFITINATAKAGAPMTETDFLTQAQAAWQNVGPDNVAQTIVSSIFLKQVVSSWVDGMRRTDATTTKVTAKVDAVENDLGYFEFTPNFHCPDTDMYGLNMKNYIIHPYKNLDWQTEDLAKDGAYQRGHVKGTFTLEAQGNRASWKITGASTSRADYPSLATL